ncbi:chorismate mutase [Candidatus Falkowbacteria bacterium]|nr:chorismate mutase [Candidatus Falkowbacteria bacterium]
MNNGLEGWRKEINELDRQLIRTLEARFRVVEKIAGYKRTNGLPVRDEKREQELLALLAEDTSLSPQFLRDLYAVIFANSYLIEQ